MCFNPRPSVANYTPRYYHQKAMNNLLLPIKRIPLLLYGHGSLVNGHYDTAPSKQFRHSKGAFHGDGWFYEGVWNQMFCKRVIEKLSELRIPYIWINETDYDMPLSERVERIQWYQAQFNGQVFLNEYHCNASPSHRGRGFEVFTTRGEDLSDTLAQMKYTNVYDLLGKDKTIKMRPDRTDQDDDKEADFYVIKKAKCPGKLSEFLFFDNYDDAILLMDDRVVEKFVEAEVRTIIEFMTF
jgi:N-acetylmuramoyl-L-alanine amidase